MSNGYRARIFEIMDGKHHILDGVSGNFKYERRLAIYPYKQEVHHLIHYPDRDGKESDVYLEKKYAMMQGDDWTSDVSKCDFILDLVKSFVRIRLSFSFIINDDDGNEKELPNITSGFHTMDKVKKLSEFYDSQKKGI